PPYPAWHAPGNI
nr:Chain P, Phage Display Derived Antigen [synthetic construct]4BH7_P Chain P, DODECAPEPTIDE ANTIGEN [synthetic construct]